VIGVFALGFMVALNQDGKYLDENKLFRNKIRTQFTRYLNQNFIGKSVPTAGVFTKSFGRDKKRIPVTVASLDFYGDQEYDGKFSADLIDREQNNFDDDLNDQKDIEVQILEIANKLKLTNIQKQVLEYMIDYYEPYNKKLRNKRGINITKIAEKMNYYKNKKPDTSRVSEIIKSISNKYRKYVDKNNIELQFRDLPINGANIYEQKINDFLEIEISNSSLEAEQINSIEDSTQAFIEYNKNKIRIKNRINELDEQLNELKKNGENPNKEKEIISRKMKLVNLLYSVKKDIEFLKSYIKI
jgi:hypothetical protein